MLEREERTLEYCASPCGGALVRALWRTLRAQHNSTSLLLIDQLHSNGGMIPARDSLWKRSDKRRGRLVSLNYSE